MPLLLWPVVIFVTFLAVMLVAAWRTGEAERVDLLARVDDALADREPAYGPFPADTGPLLLLSEQAAALVALEREVEAMCEAAERKIGPVR